MTPKSNQHRHPKPYFTEDEIYILLQRYSANTVIALLQEVSQFQDSKIDWNSIVKTTCTGISSAREYQMLWRHLAYRHPLLDNLDDQAQPLDEDSDLECEVEAFPSIDTESSAEAAACVKVLIASSPSSSSASNASTIEAPLTINIPSGQSPEASSENSQPASCSNRGINITVPVFVSKQPNLCTDELDANEQANGSLPPRKKRKPWTPEEDQELRKAVEGHGEGNWATILKGPYKFDRTPSQLSQRWVILKKQNAPFKGSDSQLSERQLAARQALCLALHDVQVPRLDRKVAFSIGGRKLNNASTSSPVPTLPVEGSTPATAMFSGTASKPRLMSKKPPINPAPTPDPMVKAVAVAVGARIATQSDADTLMKAAHVNNAVHIIKSPNPGLAKSLIGPNARNIRIGTAPTPYVPYPASISRPHSMNQLSVRTNVKDEAKPCIDTKASGSVGLSKNEVQEVEDKTSSPNQGSIVAKISNDGPITVDNWGSERDDMTTGMLGKRMREDEFAVDEKCEGKSVNDELQKNVQSMVTDGESKEVAGNEMLTDERKETPGEGFLVQVS